MYTEKAAELLKAYRRGEPFSTKDGESFVEVADLVSEFLRECGPEYWLVAADLARASASVSNALSLRDI